ncbi:shikimate dehydrogenase [Pallidibacillus pasinlerensis]|uniref:Shikimate dehydrogenase (NADP(+)) n=1 Tax=Pallidibacillus pasinlerensis TaxID=2703818 RepID=A0ABX0A8G9_9BACI|nr:shikimate dehydrogenase [Pallidibacillus pasinlerensis]NCU17483.1 shikimate dehydrogenase [Pallidibacillus pasinlerensis]
MLLGVIGDPVEHSLSPVIHEEFFRITGVQGKYKKFYIKKGMLNEGVKKLLNIGVSGFNVTVPHKEDIIPLLDEIDETARKIGAVNTVKVEKGKLIGYNTDAEGYILSLKQKDPTFHNKKTLIIGAGGAAKAIYYALVNNNVKSIDICNRSLNKAEELIKASNRILGEESRVYSLPEVEGKINEFDILIQTTSVGMSPNTNASPISLENLQGNGKIASDIIYTPNETKFLQEAKEKGALTFNGVNMLLYQAALAFEIWTNKRPPIDTARELMLKQLEGVR